MTQFRSKTVTGTNNLVLNNALNHNILSLNKKGALQKNIITTTNLYNYKDTSYVTTGITVDEEGWIIVNYDNTENTSMRELTYSVKTSNKLKENTQYAIIVEVEHFNNINQFNINSYFYDNNNTQFDYNIARYEPATLIALATTLDSFENATTMLKTQFYIKAGSIGTMKFRISVLEDTSITLDNFIYSPYIEDSVEFKTIENLSIKLSDNLNNSKNIAINLHDEFLGKIGEVQDELNIDEYGIVSIAKKILKIDSYSDEDITTDYISSTDDLSEGATVYYVNPNPYSKNIGIVNIATLEGTNNVEIISALDSETTIEYVIGINEYDNNLIRVYDSTETLFDNNGIKILHPLLAEITKKDNDDYYVELIDTIDNLDYYQKGMIIRITTPWGVQGFRCDNPSIKNNRVECKAWHLSYDSKNYVIADSYAVDKNCNDALDHFNSATDRTSPFTTISDISAVLSTRIVRKTLFETYQTLISDDKYGGHLYRDNFILGIKANIGQDRGVVLSQNKNITDMQISENWDNVCTKILPYTTDGEVAILLDDTYVELDEDLYNETYTKVIKFDNPFEKEDFETEEYFLTATKTWLKTQADNYLQANKIPKVNYSVSAKIDNVSDVGDVIYVKHPRCKVDIKTNVIGIVYDARRKKYLKIEFGNFKKEIKNLTQEITEIVKKDTENVLNENKVLLQKELEDATSKINSVLGNSYVQNNENEIIVVDRLPKEEAVNCLKINSSGIGFSNTGITGTFNSAWLIDGTLDMQNINVINLTASLIKGGVLKLGGLDNSSGTFELYDNENNLIALMDKTGLTVYATNGDYVKLNAEEGFVGYDKNGNKSYWADGNVFHMANAEIENITKFAGMIQLVPVNTSSNKGIGFVAISSS